MIKTMCLIDTLTISVSSCTQYTVDKLHELQLQYVKFVRLKYVLVKKRFRCITRNEVGINEGIILQRFLQVQVTPMVQKQADRTDCNQY